MRSYGPRAGGDRRSLWSSSTRSVTSSEARGRCPGRDERALPERSTAWTRAFGPLGGEGQRDDARTRAHVEAAGFRQAFRASRSESQPGTRFQAGGTSARWSHREFTAVELHRADAGAGAVHTLAAPPFDRARAWVSSSPRAQRPVELQVEIDAAFFLPSTCARSSVPMLSRADSRRPCFSRYFAVASRTWTTVFTENRQLGAIDSRTQSGNAEVPCVGWKVLAGQATGGSSEAGIRLPSGEIALLLAKRNEGVMFPPATEDLPAE